jgi:NAD dependent epimerase/dehydratase
MRDAFWSGKRVLVTGAGGFIGSHLVEELVQAGATVRAFVRYTSRADVGLLRHLPPAARAALELIAGDLRDAHAVNQATAGCEIVFHLGAIISIPYSYRHPAETAATNVMGTLNVLQACRAHGARLIHTSTSEVYGTALRTPMDETHPLQGQSPYSASKIGADKLVESYVCAFELPAVTVRPFNTYGPRQSARAVIPTIITQALTQETVMLGALNTRRDFTYVADTVNGFLQAAQRDAALGQVVNLGSGTEVTIGELAQLIIGLIGRPVTIHTDAQRLRPQKSEVLRLLADNGRARELIDWAPQTALGQGLAATIAWVRDNLEAYRIGRYEI